MVRRILLMTLLCLCAAAPAPAKEYHAERFDSEIRVRGDGSMLVKETIVFVFDSGTFRYVFRTIPTRRTDGVEFVVASMDGRALSTDSDTRHLRLQRKKGLRVEWRFEPLGRGRHTFELEYVVRGVVTQSEEADELAWQALPREHAYRIEASTVRLVAPASPIQPLEVQTRRVDGGTTVETGDATTVIYASSIRRNGWVLFRGRYERGALVDEAPAWQLQRVRHFEMMPTWAALAGGVLLVGFVLLTALRQGYDSPPRTPGVAWTSLIPPDPLAPAIAGALTTNAQPRLEHAMATLFALADRGVLRIREERRRSFGQRAFTIERLGRPAGLAPHEDAALAIVFRGSSTDTVSVSKARSLLTRHGGRFKRAVESELRNQGFLDELRTGHRRRYTVIGVVLLGVTMVALGAVIPVLDRFGPWPLLVALALLILSLSSFIFAAAETPLSNEGVRRAEAWDAYKRHLKDPQEIEPRWGASGAAEARILPFVVALGLAAAWSKCMKGLKAAAPPWFEAASHVDSSGAFAAFVATGGSGAHSSGGAGGGAAGGGASGAG